MRYSICCSLTIRSRASSRCRRAKISGGSGVGSAGDGSCCWACASAAAGVVGCGEAAFAVVDVVAVGEGFFGIFFSCGIAVGMLEGGVAAA